jgi:hypothetical protein
MYANEQCDDTYHSAAGIIKEAMTTLQRKSGSAAARCATLGRKQPDERKGAPGPTAGAALAAAAASGRRKERTFSASRPDCVLVDTPACKQLLVAAVRHTPPKTARRDYLM